MDLLTRGVEQGLDLSYDVDGVKPSSRPNPADVRLAFMPARQLEGEISSSPLGSAEPAPAFWALDRYHFATLLDWDAFAVPVSIAFARQGEG